MPTIILFNTVLEVLARVMRQEKNWKGSNMFADDMIFICRKLNISQKVWMSQANSRIQGQHKNQLHFYILTIKRK